VCVCVCVCVYVCVCVCMWKCSQNYVFLPRTHTHHTHITHTHTKQTAHAHLTEILQTSQDKFDVRILITSLTNTIKFERELAIRFHNNITAVDIGATYFDDTDNKDVIDDVCVWCVCVCVCVLIIKM